MLHLVVPAGVDDPARPSGGNRYDVRLADELRAAGQLVHEHRTDDLAVLDTLPDRALTLVDGLVARAAPSAFVHAAGRLRLGLLLHMLAGDAAERSAVSAAATVITTSAWGRAQVIARHGVAPERVHVALPGADPAPVARGSADGGDLLCVAVVAEHKGHDVLFDALARLPDLPWRLACVGRLDRDPDFVASLRRHAVAERVTFLGALTPAELGTAYAAADLLVHPTRAEMYGLVVTEALGHAVPVLASGVGGVPEAVGDAGLLVPPDDPGALADALRSWLTCGEGRVRLRRAAATRRASLPSWSATASAVIKAVGP